MPYDAGANGADNQRSAAERRGPMRPELLASARTRVRGEDLARAIQLSDVIALAAACITGFGRGPEPLLPLLAGSVVILIGLAALKAYALTPRERLARHLQVVAGAVGAGAWIMSLVAVVLWPADHGVLLGIIHWSVRAAALVCAVHLTWFLMVRRLRRQGVLTPNLMVVGATPVAEQLIRAALASRSVNILGIFDDRRARAPSDILGVPVLGSTADLREHRLLPYVDRIVVAVPSRAMQRVNQLIQELAPVPNAISLLLDNATEEEQREARDRLLEMPLAHVSAPPRQRLQATAKRALDLVVATVALIVLAPVLATIAIAVRMDSPGPAFFRQRRHGYFNEEVVVWKFRTMRVEAADAQARRQVTANDDRVTKVGRFLRRTSLDELPQLWNVIRGEMSIVGPRPHAIGMLSGGEEVGRLVECYAHRHRIKPGLTGWAAVNGSRGPVDTPEAVRRRVSLDLEYVERQSFWLDIWIILLTVPCLLGDSEAVR